MRDLAEPFIKRVNASTGATMQLTHTTRLHLLRFAPGRALRDCRAV